MTYEVMVGNKATATACKLARVRSHPLIYNPTDDNYRISRGYICKR